MEGLEQVIAQVLTQDSMRLEIRNAGVFRFLASYRFDRHNHRETEIIYIKSGHCIVGTDEGFLPLREGDCVVVHRGVPHWFFVDKKEVCQIAQLEFQAEFPDYFRDAFVFFRANRFQKLSGCERVGELLESIGRRHRLAGSHSYDSLQMKLLFFQLFTELSGIIEEKDKMKGSSKIDKIVGYINQHYEDDLSVENLADRFGISSRYLRRCFKEETGINCVQYITSLRMEKAKEFLWLSGKTVTEIASLTGFNSSQYFSRLFRQYTGQTPVEYRNCWKGRRAEERCVIEEGESRN